MTFTDGFWFEAGRAMFSVSMFVAVAVTVVGIVCIHGWLSDRRRRIRRKR